jgi:SAM-dependent methyltransferase
MRGWQLEYRPEVLEGDTPWNYECLASELAKASDSIVDLGTGGGEAYSSILNGSNGHAYATEEWGPNGPVTRCSSLQLPFSDQVFDLVLARHEAIDPIEVSRVLRPKGRFLSQQVIRDFMHELAAYFPERIIFPDFFSEYQKGFLQSGLQVVRAEEFRYTIQFRELCHLVYQLVAAPWTIPGFSVDSHIEGLSQLSDQQRNGIGLIFTAGYYLLEVKKDGIQ